MTAAGLSVIALGLPKPYLDVRISEHAGVDAVMPLLGRLPLQRLHLGPVWSSSQAELLAVFLPNWRVLLRG